VQYSTLSFLQSPAIFEESVTYPVSHPAFSLFVEALCPGVRWPVCEADHHHLVPILRMTGTTPSRLRFTSRFAQTHLCPSSPFILISASSRAFYRRAFIVFLQGFFLYEAVLSPSEVHHLICVISGFRRKVAANCAYLGFYAASRGGGNYRYYLRNNPEERRSHILISRYYVYTLLVPKMFSLTAKLHNSLTRFDFLTALGKCSK
jgi:hypothetical protein